MMRLALDRSHAVPCRASDDLLPIVQLINAAEHLPARHAVFDCAAHGRLELSACTYLFRLRTARRAPSTTTHYCLPLKHENTVPIAAEPPPMLLPRSMSKKMGGRVEAMRCDRFARFRRDVELFANAPTSPPQFYLQTLVCILFCYWY